MERSKCESAFAETETSGTVCEAARRGPLPGSGCSPLGDAVVSGFRWGRGVRPPEHPGRVPGGAARRGPCTEKEFGIVSG